MKAKRYRKTHEVSILLKFDAYNVVEMSISSCISIMT